jgi:short-subunit dehydrogenase
MTPNRKVALVTGASSGIGRAAAVALGRAGYTVVLAARRADRLEEVGREIRSAGGTATAWPTDLALPGAAAALVRETVASHGALDLLVNNAGWGYCAPLDRMPEAAARRLFELNLIVPFLLMGEALPHLRKTRGVIINIASVAGLLASPYYAAYSASKAALIAAANSLRIEERGSGVRVVSICPGPVASEFGEAAGGAPVHADRVGVRVQSSEEIARIIVRHATRPGRTVVTAAVVHAGVLIGRFCPPLYDLLAARWAKRLAPEIVRGLGES